jgi:DNA-binding HxlR family transcriptional regulator
MVYSWAMSMRSYGDLCGVARALDVVGERWALLIVRELLLGPKRFSDLHAGLPGASPNVVSQRLRELTDSGVVARTDLGAPAHVHVYELTPWGRELEPVLLLLGRWGAQTALPSCGELSTDSMMMSIKAMFDPTQDTDLCGAYEVCIDADAFALQVEAGGIDIRRGAQERPDARLTTDANTLRAIFAHSQSIDDALQSGKIAVEGDQDATKRLIRLIGSG